jgi:sigma-E factor negative regulatory protein RseA
VLGVQTFNQPEPTEPFSTAPTMSPTGGLAPVSLEQTRALQTQDRSAMLEKRRHINALLADHEQQVKLKSDDEKDQSSQEPETQPKP